MPLMSLIPYYNLSTPSITYFDYMSSLSPVSYWRLGESVGEVTAIDSTGNYHGSYLGTPLPTLEQTGLITNDVDTAVTFTGTLGQMVDCGALVGNTGIRTIVASFSFTNVFDSTAPEYQSLILRWDDDGDGTANEENFGLYFDKNTGQLVFIRYIGTDFSGIVRSNQTIWNAGQIYHVVATIDPVDGMMLYIDGVKQQETHISTVPVQSITGSNTTIGHWGEYVGVNRAFVGIIDDVILYSTSLTQTEAENSYRLSKNWTLTPTTYHDSILYNIPSIYLRMDDQTDIDIIDSTFNYNGIYSGNPSINQPGLLINNTNNSVLFDGIDDIGNITSVAPFLLDQPTGSYMFLCSIPSGGKATITFNNDNNDSPYIYNSVTETGVTFAYKEDAAAIGVTNFSISANTTIIPNITYHIAVVQDDLEGVLIYINGALVSTTIDFGSPGAKWWNTNPDINVLSINGSISPTPTFSNSTIDEISIFSHKLTQNEIIELYRISIGYIPNDTSYKNEILYLSPIAYWRLGELSGTLAADELLNNNGTYINAPTLGTTGLVANDGNPATYFNGTNQYVNIGTGLNNIIGTNDFSITCLVNFNNITNITWRLIQNRGTGGTSSNLPGFQLSGTGGLIQNTYVQTSTDNYATLNTDNTTYFAVGNTYHIVLTYNYNTAELLFYLDGVLASTGTLIGSPQGQDFISSRNMSLAIAENDLSQALDGTLDEVAIYSKVLTPSEISNLYQKSIGN